ATEEMLLEPQVATNRHAGLLPLASLDEPMPPVALMTVDAIQVHPNGHGEIVNLDGLTASIQEHGVLQPLIVAPDGHLLAGRRRLEAARRAGLAMVPVRVCEIATERAAIEISLIENIERTDLDPITRARCYRGLVEQGAEVEEIAALVGQESAHVYQHLALLDLHPSVQQAVETRLLCFTDARGFAKLAVQDQATVLADIEDASQHQAVGKPLSSREIRRRVDTQRVLRLAESTRLTVEGKGGEAPKGDYTSLFQRENDKTRAIATEPQPDPLSELHALIAEMIAAAQGENQLRGWARRLSRILGALQDAAAARGPKIVQERLWKEGSR
ncbi:MAG: ParB/RepB/Spo0J family partition protein, partial [Chloroflexi bacterium]|nr:ParB/RepB/Spo0J family partition protein [Chloroflexota bacterium]